MKSKAMIPLLLGLVVGLVAIKFGVDAIQRAKGDAPEAIATVVARQDIPASAEITPEMLAVIETPKTPLIPVGAFSSIEELKGRVSSKSIPQGSVMAPTFLAPPGTPAGINERIEEGYRAFTVKIDEASGVAGQLKPGDFVDAIVVMRITRGRQAETISRIILQRVKVLAVGQNLDSSSSSTGPQKLARSITLLVRDIDVPKLHLAQTQGKVTLAMRGTDDTMMAEDDGHTSTDEWSEPGAEPVTPTAVQTPQPVSTPGSQVKLALAAPDQDTQVVDTEPFSVTVINGPLQANGATPIQQVVYENRTSMKVVNVGAGRTGNARTPSVDSAESVLRERRQTTTDIEQDRLPGQYPGRSTRTPEPQDREIPEE